MVRTGSVKAFKRADGTTYRRADMMHVDAFAPSRGA